MSDRFSCLPIEDLVQWILTEERSGAIFGIPRDLFFVPTQQDPYKIDRYQETLETPIGVAAGPHTQLSQNIVASWLCGARYLELKTVQTLDELELTKPCIQMRDEGYNCEWSQELKLDQSYQEYLNAWIAIHLLKDKFGWGDPDSRGFLFNMSLGYDLQGIKSEGVQRFLSKMADCSIDKNEKIERLKPLYPRIADIDIPDCISDNITISTMHGCPPDEIEKIGDYFISERRLHTAIKLNPTLLGADRLREILNQSLGFEVTVPDEAFEHDLRYPDAVDLIKNLRHKADQSGVAFGLKLTNTLEALNRPGVLPEKERMVYMSGRPLHAISIHVASRLQDTFEGQLDLSFSAGADCFNVAQVLACNLKPVTVCTDILKPGGYTRLAQYLEETGKRMQLLEADSIDSLVLKTAGMNVPAQATRRNLMDYAEAIVLDKRYHKEHFPFDSIKTDRDLTLFDCTQAPCISTCPTEQDIPAYIGFAAAGNYAEAHRVILETNPFPNVQGKVCHHPCRTKCTRINLDSPLRIREIKRFVAEQYAEASPPSPKPRIGKRVAIIGAGASGLSCAYYLALEGFEVHVLEAAHVPGGMAASAIPSFRLDAESLTSDIKRIKALGVVISTNQKIDAEAFEELRKNYDFIFIAVGAQESMTLGIADEDLPGVIDPLAFLRQVRQGKIPQLGAKVVVIGGGNSAMDAARTAKRLVGDTGDVTILYRRTIEQMPAEREEIEETLNEGIEIIELVSPEAIIQKENRATGIECSQMALGDPDESGRARPIKLDEPPLRFGADTIIPAIGQRVVLDFLPEGELHVNTDTYETEMKGVFAGGDAVRGAATLVEAIADGRRTAENIIKYGTAQSKEKNRQKVASFDFVAYQKKLARRVLGLESKSSTEMRLGFDLASRTMNEAELRREAERCLSCDMVCAICTTVCPNRANIAVPVETTDLPLVEGEVNNGSVRVIQRSLQQITEPLQIVNVADFCNECGNCTTFCPTSGAPYKVKPKICLSSESFKTEQNGYYKEGNTLFAKKEGKLASLILDGEELEYQNDVIKVRLDPETLSIISVETKQTLDGRIDLSQAPLMGFLHKTLANHALFQD